MSYTYEYPRPAVIADCVVITKENETIDRSRSEILPLASLASG